MRQKFVLLFVTTIIFFVACQQPVNQSQNLDMNSSLIPDLTAEEIQTLSDMLPQVTAIVSSRTQTLGAKNINTSEVIQDSETAIILLDDITDLLKEKFGDQYEKFIITGYVTKSEIYTSAKTTSVTTWTGTQYLYTGWWCKYASTPFGTWTWSGCGIQRLDGNFIQLSTGSSASTTYSDEVTSLKNAVTDPTYVKSELSGNFKWGFFPRINNIVISFRVNDYWLANGSVSTTQGYISNGTWYSPTFTGYTGGF